MAESGPPLCDCPRFGIRSAARWRFIESLHTRPCLADSKWQGIPITRLTMWKCLLDGSGWFRGPRFNKSAALMNDSLCTAKTLTGVSVFAKPAGGSSSFRTLKLSTTEQQAQGKRRFAFMWRCGEPTYNTFRNIMAELVRWGTGWQLRSMNLSGWVRIPFFIRSVRGAARKPLLRRIGVFLLFDGC